MPNIEIQRREPPDIPWWGWVTAATAVAVMIGWFGTAGDRRAPTPPVEQVAGVREELPHQQQPDIEDVRLPTFPLTEVLNTPTEYLRTEVEGVATVGTIEGPGFWIQDAGKQLFVVQEPSLAQMPPGLQTGDQVLVQGTLDTPDNRWLASVDPTLQLTLRQQPFLLYADTIIRVRGTAITPSTTPPTGGPTSPRTPATTRSTPSGASPQQPGTETGRTSETETGAATGTTPEASTGIGTQTTPGASIGTGAGTRAGTGTETSPQPGAPSAPASGGSQRPR